MSMPVHFTDPELQTKVDQWVSETGRPAEELVEDAVAGFFAEQAQICHTLDSRYDDIKNGKVKLIPGEEVRAYFDAKFASRR